MRERTGLALVSSMLPYPPLLVTVSLSQFLPFLTQKSQCSYFQVPKRLLEQLAVASDPWAEDDSDLVFDDDWQPSKEAEAKIDSIETTSLAAAAAEHLQAEAAVEADQEGWVRVSGVDIGLGGPEPHPLEAAEGDAQPGPSGREQPASPEEQRQWDAFDTMVENWLAAGGSERPRAEVASYAEQEGEGVGPGLGPVNVLCARCYSLRHYGQVREESGGSSASELIERQGNGMCSRSGCLCMVSISCH